jgi:hypothetical protein
MVDRPIREAMSQTAQKASKNARALCAWLPNPHRCDCGAWCDAQVQWVPRQAMTMRVWQCSECERRYHRTRE